MYDSISEIHTFFYFIIKIDLIQFYKLKYICIYMSKIELDKKDL